VVATLLCSQVACSYGQGGRRIRLSGEAHVERRLRTSVEEGRLSTLGRSIGGRGLSGGSAVLVGFLFIGERLGSYVGIPTPN
jgi:hypothetical protein